ncbi:ribosomal subunit interface protein [bacterium]|nr:ribosomal subunit interface protein [bacterium]
MSFPEINYKSTNTDLESSLQELVGTKLESLGKFIGDETDLRCEVEFEKVAPHKSGEVHRVEVNLWVGGTMFRAEATENSFEKAVDEVRDELNKELRRTKKKQDSLVRKGGRKIKEMLRWG